jgi:Flp pilus assembly protein TadG
MSFLTTEDSPAKGLSHGLRRGLRSWRKDARGTTAVEFAIVGVPFLMMCFGVITVGLHFLTTYSLENAVERAGRLIRTGQAQQGSMSADQFKQKICENAASYIDCTHKMRVHVQSWADFASVAPKACLDNGGNLAGSGNGGAPISDSSGGASRVVLITVCYEWELAARLPFLRLGKMTNGSALIQAATTFKTEPFM